MANKWTMLVVVALVGCGAAGERDESCDAGQGVDAPDVAERCGAEPAVGREVCVVLRDRFGAEAMAWCAEAPSENPVCDYDEQAACWACYRP